MKRIGLLLIGFVLLALAAVAQDDGQQSDNGFLLNMVENRLSAPGRQIRLSGVTGALSSQARIERVTISDADGAWLEIDNVELNWSRLALLRGRVAIDRLSADRINWLRRAEMPPAAPTLPQAEATPFSLPELPVSIQVSQLAIGDFSFAEPVFGRAARLSVDGALSLTRGTLDSKLAIRRVDGPGGELTLAAGFSNESRRIDVDLDLHEPAGGIIATLLRIEGEPAIDLSLQGSGPLDKVDLDFSLDADKKRLATGVVALRSTDSGLGFDVNFNGTLSPLVPAPYRDFFAGEGVVRVQGVSKAAGGLRIDRMAIQNDVLDLDGSLETGNDGFLRDLTLTGALGDPAGPPITLPVPGARTSLNAAALHVDFGESSRWTGFLALDRLQAADIQMEDVTLRFGGLAQNLGDPATRSVTISAEGLATGVWSADPKVAQALGSRIDLFADVGMPAGAPIAVNQLQISANGLSIFSAGKIEKMVYTGRNSVRIADVAVFGGIANRPLSGGLNVRANGSVAPLSGAFDLTFDGGATELVIGIDRVDPLLAGATQISGRAVRDETGIRTENLRVENPQVSFVSNGEISSGRTDIGFEAKLSDLTLVDPRLGGAATATGRATGQGRPISVDVTAAIPNGRLQERKLANARLGFSGTVDGSDVKGSVTGGGALDGLVLSLAGDIAAVGEDRAINGLQVSVGPNRLTGDVARSGTAPATGQLTLAAPDIGTIAALALVEASGAVDATIRLDAAEVGQGVAMSLDARDVVVGATRIGALKGDVAVVDALGKPLAHGTINGTDMSLSGFDIASLNAEADLDGPASMTFSANSRLAIGTLADLSGQLDRLDDGFSVRLDTLRLRQTGIAATLTAPATVTMRGGTTELTPLAMTLGDGSLTALGKIGDSFDVDLDVRDLPLELANAVRPDLGMTGRINGTARVTGPRATPNVTFQVAAAGIASAMTRGAGLPPVGLNATGSTANGRLTLDANVAADGLAAGARGSVPLGQGNIDLAIDLNAFPLALVDRIAGNRGLRGTVSGTGQVSGPLADPTVRFDLRGQGLTATVLSSNAIPPGDATATGQFHAATLTLDSARVTGAGGVDATASGRIPLSGPGLDVRVDGTLPLSIANPFLEQRSAQVTGTARVNLTTTGALSAPRFNGNVSVVGATFVDPTINLRLEQIALEARLDGTVATLDSFRAAVPAGGSIAAEGRVTLDSAAGYPADLSLRINDVRYTDGAFVSTRASGDLAMTGPLVGGAGLLSGRIDLGRTEISISEGLGAGAAALEQVQHYSPSRPVQLTIDRAKATMSRTSSAPTDRTGIGLDVQINAPNQIFVRGRGLDVEVGGSVRIRGRTTDIQPVGQFDLRRGRLIILGQRIEFDSGSVQLIGNLDPQLNFVAQTRSRDVTAIVTVSGRASSPEITFSSDPPLPQDEVLARVLFNTSTDSLSAFQLAQLAAATAELAGGSGGPGILSQLRNATGLDDLDIITQEDGSTALRAGKYLSDNVYVDVETDTEGGSRAAISLDVNDTVTVRGSVGSDGNTTIGLFYERDY